MVRDEILFGLLKFNLLSKTAIHVLSSAPSTIDRPLLTLSGRGLIKEYTVYEKNKNNKKTIIFYTLTTFGIRAVKNSDEIAKLHPWVEGIPLFKTDEDFFQFRNSEAEILLRYLKQTEISFMAQSLGYEVPPIMATLSPFNP